MSLALMLTWVVEGITALIYAKEKKYLLFSIWVNAITNPLLNALGLFVVFNFWGQTAWIIYVAIGEIIVLFAEAKLYDAFDRLSGGVLKSKLWYFKLSAIANILSFSAGLLLDKLI